MTQEGAVPAQYNEQLRRMVREEVAAVFRSAPLRSARISEGGTLTVDGGNIKVTSANGVETFYVGGMLPALPDGSRQPGVVLRREDGTAAMALYDPVPSEGDYNQFLALFDRAGNVIFSDDTDSGQGIARPYIGGGFTPARFNDWTVSTTSTTFETLWETNIPKQHPRLSVGIRAVTGTADTTGETRVLVNGQQLGAVSAESWTNAYRYFGPDVVAGDHPSGLTIEVQGRVTGGTASLRVAPRYWRGQQS